MLNTTVRPRNRYRKMLTAAVYEHMLVHGIMKPESAANSASQIVSEEHMGSKWAAAAAVAAVVGLGGPAALVAVELKPQQPAISYSILPEKDSPELQWWRDSMKTHDQRMQWFRQARFGMFIH